MVYMAESLISLSGIPSGPVALFALSDLTILSIPSLEAGGKQKSKSLVKHFLFSLAWFLKIQWFFYCSSILTLRIRIANWGGSLSRNGLYSTYIVVIKTFSGFSEMFLRIPFSSRVILSLIMIPLLEWKRVWLYCKMILCYDFLCCDVQKTAYSNI